MARSKPTSVRRERWVSLTVRLTRPEYKLIASAAYLCGVSIQKFVIDASLATAIPL